MMPARSEWRVKVSKVGTRRPLSSTVSSSPIGRAVSGHVGCTRAVTPWACIAPVYSRRASRRSSWAAR